MDNGAYVAKINLSGLADLRFGGALPCSIAESDITKVSTKHTTHGAHKQCVLRVLLLARA